MWKTKFILWSSRLWHRVVLEVNRNVSQVYVPPSWDATRLYRQDAEESGYLQGGRGGGETLIREQNLNTHHQENQETCNLHESPASRLYKTAGKIMAFNILILMFFKDTLFYDITPSSPVEIY
jgi:hypothetical protein